MGKFKGYRTYILGASAVVAGVAGYLVGDMSAMEAAQSVYQGLIAITIRSAIPNMGRIL